MSGPTKIVTISLGAAALVTLVYGKDRITPTPGVRTAIELIGNGIRGAATQGAGFEQTWASEPGLD